MGWKGIRDGVEKGQRRVTEEIARGWRGDRQESVRETKRGVGEGIKEGSIGDRQGCERGAREVKEGGYLESSHEVLFVKTKKIGHPEKLEYK